ncbi:MAG: hypothetical protein IPN67_02300 [Bacteroidales bacterium]|nr:hypothetical protein [Bacteroidales bacterium]
MILIRFFLIGLIVYLIVRSFKKFGDGNGPSSSQNSQDKNERPSSKKVSKEIGEYIDYEELRK